MRPTATKSSSRLEATGFVIKDVASGASAIYVYKGVGLVIGLPKIPKVGGVQDALSKGGVSTSGPSNPFTAPGYMSVDDFEGDATMQTFYNVGMGTDTSANVFEFGGNVDEKPGFLVRISPFRPVGPSVCPPLDSPAAR